MSAVTEQQTDTLQTRLKEDLQRLTDQVHEEMRPDQKQNYIDIATNVHDIGDAALADTMIDTDNAMIGLHLQHIRDIDAALERIHIGVYGICMHCGCEIGFDRLSAHPTAKRCFECQNQHEKTFAGRPTTSL
jgi:DnaK suppressor protein